jgi:hypothetical protein
VNPWYVLDGSVRGRVRWDSRDDGYGASGDGVSNKKTTIGIVPLERYEYVVGLHLPGVTGNAVDDYLAMGR